MVSIDVLRLEESYSGSYPPDILGPQVPPVLTSLLPTSIVVNTPTPVTITGTGFKSNTRVVVDGVAQSTQFISATQVRYVALADSLPSQDVGARNGSSDLSNELLLSVTAAFGDEEGLSEQVAPPPAPEPEPEVPPEEPAPEG